MEKEKGKEVLGYGPSPPEKQRPPIPKKQKLITAAIIFYGNISFGCAFNTYGSVSTSMEKKYDTDADSISVVFTVLTVGYMVGALCGGVIYNFVNRQLAMIVIVATMAAMMILTPLCPSKTLFFVTAGVMGICCGSYDTAQFVWMMEMMQKECPPYVMAQHFFYALGTAIAGPIMAPFLDDDDETDKEVDDWKLLVPYLIVGGLIVLNLVAQILLFTFMRYYPPPPEEESVESEQTQDISSGDEKSEATIVPQESSSMPSWLWSLSKFRIVILACCLYGAYQGMEMCTFQFFSKFAQKSEVGLSESDAAYVLTGMNTAFAAGRAVAIVVVFKISTQLIVCVNILVTLIANILLIFWAGDSLTVLWACSITFGLGFSSYYPALSAYVERYLNFTNFITGLVIVCGSGVASIYPLIVGKYIEENPVVLSYVSFFSIAVITIAFGTMSYITHKDKTRHL